MTRLTRLPACLLLAALLGLPPIGWASPDEEWLADARRIEATTVRAVAEAMPLIDEARARLLNDRPWRPTRPGTEFARSGREIEAAVNERLEALGMPPGRGSAEQMMAMLDYRATLQEAGADARHHLGEIDLLIDLARQGGDRATLLHTAFRIRTINATYWRLDAACQASVAAGIEDPRDPRRDLT